MAEKESAFQLARLLAVLGGAVVILWGILRFTSLIERGNVPSLDFAATVAVYGVLGVELGLISVAGSKFVKNIAWSIVLIVVGVLAFSLGVGFPWYMGPVLVVLSGLAGIVGKLV